LISHSHQAQIHIYKTIKHILILSLFINLSLAQSAWVKTESGCEFWTLDTNAEKVTWDGDCKDGKVHGEGTLVLYKKGEAFYEFNGVMLDGYTKKGEIRWMTGNYANYFWLWDDDPSVQKIIGKYEGNGETRIGEINGFEEAHLVVIYEDGTYKSGIEINNKWREVKTVEEIENHFINNYAKSDYEHIIPIEISKKTIAISYFDNTGGDKSYDPLIKGLADMLISDLSNIESIKMVEREKLDALMKEIDLGGSKFIDNETAQKMGKGLGAQYILTGSFIVMGDAFRVDARLINVENGEIVFSKAVDGNKETFFDIEKELAKEIISKLELSVSKKTLSLMEELGTRSYDAFDNWKKGLFFYGDNQYDSAMVYYNNSLEIDPLFDSPKKDKFAIFTLLVSLRYPDGLTAIGSSKPLPGSLEDNQIIIDYFEYCEILNNNTTGLEDDHKFILKEMLEALYVKISESYFQSFNNKTRALEIALRGTKKFPENDRILYQYGLLNYNVKDYQKAIIAFDQLYKRTPDYKGLLQTMSVIFQELENWERVIEINEKRLQLEPNNYYVLRNLAFTNFNIGEYATAIEYFIKFPQLGGGKAEAFTNTGISYYSLNQYSKAIDYLEKAFEVIESYEPEGALGTSKDQIEKRLLPFIFDYLALSYERIGGYNKAIEIYKKYIDIVENPKDLSRLNTNLAFSYQELDSLNKAKKYYEKAIELDSNNWHVYNNYAYFYQKQGDLKTAEDMYKANIQRAPNIPNVLHSMGEFYQQMGEYDKAIDYFDSSIEIDSTYAISHYNLGQIYEERENDLFFEYYLKAAELNNKDAQRWVTKNRKLIDEHENKSKKTPATDYIEELKKLAELRDLGIITEEEFQQKKKELLGIK